MSVTVVSADSAAPSSWRSLVSHRLFRVATAVVVVVLVAVGFRALAKSSPAESSQSAHSAEPVGNPQPSAQTPTHIMTKDPELAQLLHPPTGEDDILAYSTAYVQKKQEIDAKLAQVNDPDLRSRLASDEWAKLDKDSYLPEAEDNLRTSLSKRMYAFLERHRADWFEVGHVDYPDSGSLLVKSVEASPLELPEGESISLDIATMDGVYSKFRDVAMPAIQAGTDQWMYEQSCTAHLRNACENLGGSPEECSEPSKLQEIEQQLGQGGILVGCDDNPSADKGREIAEKKERENRLVLVGQGDLISHRIDKLFLVDYDTETPLLELRHDALTGDIVWKFPSETDRKGGLPAYKRVMSTDSFKDFGAVALHTESDKETFHNSNDSDSPRQLEVSLQGDGADNFVLDNGCSSGLVQPHDSCDFTVYFKPNKLGLHTATVQMIGEGWGISSVSLRGNGSWPWDISQ